MHRSKFAKFALPLLLYPSEHYPVETNTELNMARLFEFSPATRMEAMFRQSWLCAWCKTDLKDDFPHGHHVVPNQAATADSAENAWIRTAENCVMLCEDCHREFGHAGGDFRNGAVPFACQYKYSHGKNFAEHTRWAARIDSRPWPGSRIAAVKPGGV
jgi:hypothetical protein